MGVWPRGLVLVLGVLAGCSFQPNENVDKISVILSFPVPKTHNEWVVQANDRVYFEERYPWPSQLQQALFNYWHRPDLPPRFKLGHKNDAFTEVYSMLAAFSEDGLNDACTALAPSDPNYREEGQNILDIGTEVIEYNNAGELIRISSDCGRNMGAINGRTEAYLLIRDRIKTIVEMNIH